MKKITGYLAIAFAALMLAFAASCSGGGDDNKGDGGNSAPPSPTGIVLNKTSLTLGVGDRETLTATVAPSGASQAVTWVSNNTGVATVSNGQVSAVSQGSARITATTQSGGFTASCDVTVNNPITVAVSPGTPILYLNGTQQFTATVEGGSGSNAVDWSVVTPSGGTITVAGFYTAPGLPGQYRVRATSQEKNSAYGEASITVIAEPVLIGEGTEARPYQINSAEQLKFVADKVNANDTNFNNKYYKLTADINLSAYGSGFNSGQGWVPIGSSNANPFRGFFDGDGHVIAGLYINRLSTYSGLFGYINGGTVEKLGIVEASITSAYSNVGAVAGYLTGNNSAVKNCYVTGTVGGLEYVGGIVGHLDHGALTTGGTLESCWTTATVSGTRYVGGIVGYENYNCMVRNCAALNPSVSGTSNIGRIIGGYYNSSYASGNVAYVGMTGGFSVTSGNSAAGLNGQSRTAVQLQTVAGFPAELNMLPWTYTSGRLPGLRGQTVAMPAHLLKEAFSGGGTETNPYLISSVADLLELKRLVELSHYDYSDKYYKLTTDLDLSAYGSGYNDGRGWIPIGTSANPFRANLDGDGHVVTGLYMNRLETYSGLFGYINGGTVEKLGIVGADITSAYNYVGGVAGYITGASADVRNCYVTGDVRGVNYVNGVGNVGGVAGYIERGTVESCWTTATVSGTRYVGGIVGYENYNCMIRNCAALNPSVSGTSNIGRVIGGYYSSSYASGNVAYSGMTGDFTVTSGATATGINGASRTASQLQTAAGFPTELIMPPWTYTPGRLPGLGGNTVAWPY